MQSQTKINAFFKPRIANKNDSNLEVIPQTPPSPSKEFKNRNKTFIPNTHTKKFVLEDKAKQKRDKAEEESRKTMNKSLAKARAKLNNIVIDKSFVVDTKDIEDVLLDVDYNNIDYKKKTLNVKKYIKNEVNDLLLKNDEVIKPIKVGIKRKVDKISIEGPSKVLKNDIHSNYQLSELLDDNKKNWDEKFLKPLLKSRWKVNAIENMKYFKSLSVTNLFDNTNETIELHGFWNETEIIIGDVISTLGQKESCVAPLTITDDFGFISLNPERLINVTSVTSTLTCLRKQVLRDTVKDYGFAENAKEFGIICLCGNLAHSVFQKAITEKCVSEKNLFRLLSIEIKNSIKAINALDCDEDFIRSWFKPIVIEICNWYDKYIVKPSKNNIQINKIVDIEDCIWLPEIGLRGKIDVTVDCKINGKDCLAPLELKTGKPSLNVEHEGQLMLYNYMLSLLKKDSSIDKGLLLYIRKGKEMEIIKNQNLSTMHILRKRNQYIAAVKKFEETLKLPQPINNDFVCSKCPQKSICGLIETQKVVNPSNKHLDFVSHLSEDEKKFSFDWLEILRSETNFNSSWLSKLFNFNENSASLNGLICINSENFGSEYKNEFVPSNQEGIFDFSLFEEQDLLLISIVYPVPRLGFATGRLLSVTNNLIIVVSDRNIFCQNLKNERYRIDKRDYSASMQFGQNILQLMDNSQKYQRFRSLIIGGRPPQITMNITNEILQNIQSIIKKKQLNNSQKKILLTAFSIQDYLLVNGYPGTGKTTVIANLVAFLSSLNLKILVSTYTNSALDNIFLKLKNMKIDRTIRLGNKFKVHPDLNTYLEDELLENCYDVSKLKNKLNNIYIFGATMSHLSTFPALISPISFDYAIVDEASQATIPACLSPILKANKFILIGDTKQLTPLLTNGVGESLLERLSRFCTEICCIDMNEQYRMNKEIMELSNTLYYENKLLSGNKHVASSQLKLTAAFINEENPLHKFILNPNRCVCILLTDNIDQTCAEINGRNGVYNIYESKLAANLTQLFIDRDLDPKNIGIISPYRRQVREIKDNINNEKIQVLTIDQSQGQDKECVILSFVRSKWVLNENTNKTYNSLEYSDECSELGGILGDERRLNVALTRAKNKLIIIASRQKLLSYNPFKHFFKIIKDEQLYYLV